MIRRPIGRWWYLGLGLATILVMALGYLALAHRQKQINPSDRSIPNMRQLAEGVGEAFRPREVMITTTVLGPDGQPTIKTESRRSWDQSWVARDVRATLLRLAAGLLVGVVLAVVLGLLMGAYEFIEAAFLPPLAFLAKIPPTAMMAVFFVTVGVGFNMFVAMIAFGVLPTLTQSVYYAARKGVPDEIIHKATTLGASQTEIIWNVVTRQTLPVIIESVRLQVGPAMVYLIAAEMLVADVGMGFRIRQQQRLLDMSVVSVYLVLLGLIGFIIDSSLRRLVRWACPWYHRG